MKRGREEDPLPIDSDFSRSLTIEENRVARTVVDIIPDASPTINVPKDTEHILYIENIQQIHASTIRTILAFLRSLDKTFNKVFVETYEKSLRLRFQGNGYCPKRQTVESLKKQLDVLEISERKVSKQMAESLKIFESAFFIFNDSQVSFDLHTPLPPSTDVFLSGGTRIVAQTLESVLDLSTSLRDVLIENVDGFLRFGFFWKSAESV